MADSRGGGCVVSREGLPWLGMASGMPGAMGVCMGRAWESQIG